jgi:hypothetical protein
VRVRLAGACSPSAFALTGSELTAACSELTSATVLVSVTSACASAPDSRRRRLRWRGLRSAGASVEASTFGGTAVFAVTSASDFCSVVSPPSTG